MKEIGKKWPPSFLYQFPCVSSGRRWSFCVLKSMFIFSLMEKSQLCVVYYLNTTRSICILGFAYCCTFTGLRYDITYSHVAQTEQSTANGDLIHPQMRGNNDEKLPQVAEQNFFNTLSPLKPNFLSCHLSPWWKKDLKKHSCYNHWRIKLSTLSHSVSNVNHILLTWRICKVLKINVDYFCKGP